MKKINYLLSGSVVLLSLFLFSCRKQIAEPTADDAALLSATTQETSCKPAVFGVFQSVYGWTTVAQKWYSGGKVRNIKLYMSGASPGLGGTIAIEPLLSVEWGEVTYEGNQVRLRDVGKNRLVFRVTLDGSGMPVASYLYNQTDNSDGAMMIDTTYYYYNGNKLDYIIHFADIRLYGPNTSRVWNKFSFVYDVPGNMVEVNGLNDVSRTNFTYDYNKPVTGIIPNYILTTSFRLMEFLELLKVPMHHALMETIHGNIKPNGNFEMAYGYKYKNYVISNDGLVQSYQQDYPAAVTNKVTFYNGWDCGTTTTTASPINRQSNVISSLQQFEQLYPRSVNR